MILKFKKKSEEIQDPHIHQRPSRLTVIGIQLFLAQTFVMHTSKEGGFAPDLHYCLVCIRQQLQVALLTGLQAVCTICRVRVADGTSHRHLFFDVSS